MLKAKAKPVEDISKEAKAKAKPKPKPVEDISKEANAKPVEKKVIELDIGKHDIKRLANMYAGMEQVGERLRSGVSILVCVKSNALVKPTVANIQHHVTELRPLMIEMNKLYQINGAWIVPGKPTFIALVREIVKTLGIKISKPLESSMAWDLKRFCLQLKNYASWKPKGSRKYAFPNASSSVAGELGFHTRDFVWFLLMISVPIVFRVFLGVLYNSEKLL